MNIQATTRLDKWWKPKASNLLAILYIVMLITALPFGSALLLFIPSVITIVGIGSFGHFINDYFDIATDERAGKPNKMSGIKPAQRFLLFAAAISLAFLPWIILPFDEVSIFLMLLEFILLLAYAIPPLRLKEKKFLALFADGAYAYAVPAILAAYTFFLAAEVKADVFLLTSLFTWQLFYGVRHYLNHLATDRNNDLQSGTLTIATEKGNYFIHALIRKRVLPIELVALSSFLILTGTYHSLMPFTALFFFVLMSSLSMVLTIGRNYSIFSYRFSKTILDSYYQNYWPLIPLGFLVIDDWRYVYLFFGHAFLFYSFFRSKLSIVFRYMLKVPGIYLLAFPYLLIKKKKKSPTIISENEKGQHAVNLVPTIKKIKPGPNIAVVNINKNKYTETFINDLIPALKYNTYYLYGSELPLYDQEDRHFLSNQNALQTLAPFLEKTFRLEENYFQKQSICGYLQSKKIELVLAEFGPVGVQLYPITQSLGIPLVIYFHGYDVYHLPTLQQYTPLYSGLFEVADKILAVSEHMIKRLKELGAPAEKLFHLPAYVNLGLFPYHDHSQKPCRFLAVGRFAESKSPHLTLLAFHKVLQKLPHARLTMIGKGGGGELFEACVILAISLGIQNNVDFKGVLSHAEVAEEMKQARVFIQHSLTTPETGDCEGKPVAIMEAMASGLPVVATRHSGILELIEHGVNGILVNEYNIEAMADAMVQLANDDELVFKLGRSASEFIHHHALISRHVEILEELLDGSIPKN
ncbi:MAG: glycosyltransferase [Flavitalea sp.]